MCKCNLTLTEAIKLMENPNNTCKRFWEFIQLIDIEQ